MNIYQTIKLNTTDRKVAAVLSLLVVTFVVLTLTQDFLRSNLKNSAFYFSESFMFSSFWWLFAPLLFAQYKALSHTSKRQPAFQVAVIGLAVFLHILAFPFLVWLLSAAFYYHTYSFQQTLRYTLSEHVYLLLILYSIPFLAFQFFTKKPNPVQPVSLTETDHTNTAFINSMVVADGNKKICIAVSEVMYFAASPPYICIHMEGKKYLQHETLKSISQKLPVDQFIRVHKSTIVNIHMVASYTSRLNGDYDLVMKNNAKLRVSRNFAVDFKNLFHKTHRFTTG